jgi:hypothetical protein
MGPRRAETDGDRFALIGLAQDCFQTWIRCSLPRRRKFWGAAFFIKTDFKLGLPSSSLTNALNSSASE